MMTGVLKIVETGRRYGERQPFKIESKNHPFVVWSADFWDGPSAPGEVGTYRRITRRDSLHTYQAATNGTCSFNSELLRALS